MNQSIEVSLELTLCDSIPAYVARQQEYRDQDIADAIIRKLFPDGHLIDVDSNTAKEGRT
jgi:hypothetical protein